MKSILITGGAGFVGSNIVKKLHYSDYKIVSIDNYSTGSVSNHIDDVIYINNDIVLLEEYDLYGHFDLIIHCAAKARIQKSFINDKDYFYTNVIGSYNIIKYASLKQTPLIYIGTGSHHSGKYSNPYTFTKDVGEDIVKLYQQNFGLKASIARLYNVYGPNELTNENGTLIGKWKYNYLNNLPFIIYGNGSKRRDFTHVDDVSSAIVQIIKHNKYGYEFELGTGINYSISEIANMFQYNNILYKPDLSGEAITTLAENNETKTILNWNPKNNLIEYILEIKNYKI